jgi:hypothetical protein
MNTTPLAVAGRCLATTIPATSTDEPSGVRSRSSLWSTPSPREGLMSSIGWRLIVTPVEA